MTLLKEYNSIYIFLYPYYRFYVQNTRHTVVHSCFTVNYVLLKIIVCSVVSIDKMVQQRIVLSFEDCFLRHI